MTIPNPEEHKDWVALVRNPITRIQSLWIYDHVENAPYRRDTYGKWPLPAMQGEFREKLYGCYRELDDALTEGLTKITDQTIRSPDDKNDCPYFTKKSFSWPGSWRRVGSLVLQF